MFTGIITEIGTVRRITSDGPSKHIDVACTYPAITLGESIAVDGVCLTVTQATSDGFRATMSIETVERSTLGGLATGSPVNLERALAVGDRLGGHIVAGHVDGVARVSEIQSFGDAQRWTFTAPEAVLPFLADKGSVAIDGVSLTVNHVAPTTFDIMMVPFTRSATALGRKRVGSTVNLEVDVLARYVARALQFPRAPHDGLTMDLLARAGFVK